MSTRQILVVLVVAAAFGVLIPWYKGIGFLDRRFIVAYACLAAVFGAPGAASAFANARGNSFRTMLRVSFWSYLLAVFILALALATLNLSEWRGRLMMPRTDLLIAAECLGLTSLAAVVAITLLLARRMAPTSVTTIFRTVFLVLILALFIADRYISTPFTTAAWIRTLYIVSAVCGAAALVAAARYPET